ncbi:MAG: SGNH/GDSL hydrolase family protein [Rhizonema sp. PD37]|nr:SGNH/GDSL hydrolase family protein [Rhizonema sp. PD37]
MSTSSKKLPAWAFLSLAVNGILMLSVILLILRHQELTAFFKTVFFPQPEVTPQLGSRHQLNYSQWVDILKQEANVAASKHPQHLNILAGDSLSLWFPPELLPKDKNWLNQGISGETSTGLLKRLNLFDRTQPEKIFVMIGINDLIRGVNDKIILDNQYKIIHHLHEVHPKAEVVVESILPHQSEGVNWQGREKLLAIPNSRIRQLNQQLQGIAVKEGVRYINLYPLFANEQGNLRHELSSDGLHLNPNGYLVWSSALQLYNQIEQRSESVNGEE